MEGTWRNVTRTNPCPICGKEDYCSVVDGFNPQFPAEQLHVCRRITSQKDVISPIDGKVYIYIKELRDYSALYEEAESRAYAQEQWRLANNIHSSSRGKQRKVAPVPIQPILPKREPTLLYVPPLPNVELDKIYCSFMAKLTLYHSHKKYLLSEGWSDRLIRNSFVRSMPANGPTKSSVYFHQRTREQITKELIQEFGSVKGVPGFYLNHKGDWTFYGNTGILIPQYDTNGYLFRLRIRLDHPPVDSKGKIKNKYKNFSSYFEEKDDQGNLYNSLTYGSRSGSHLSLYTKDGDDFTVCYVTEGEKKGIYANDVLGHPVVSIPGVNSINKLKEPGCDGVVMLDYLKSKGCKYIIVAYDADKIINPKVLKCEQLLIMLLKKHGFKVGVANWNMGFGKGLDDILSVGVWPNITFNV